MNQHLTEQELLQLIAGGTETLAMFDKLDAEESFLDFIKLGWHALEPARPFVSGWAVEAICDHLEAVSNGEIVNLLINVPPGCTKSMTTNVFWPAWEWGPRNKPDLRYISCSYVQDLAIRDNVRGRDLIYSEWYQENWGDRFSFKPDNNGKITYENNFGGWRHADSVGGQLTGYRGDRRIIDDPHSVQDAESDKIREGTLQWFAETLPTRKNDQDTSATVVIMQRVHGADVSGLIIAKELGYEHLMLPMEFESERKCYSVVKPSWCQDAPLTPVWRNPDTLLGSSIDKPEWLLEAPEDDPLAKPEMRYPTDPRTEDGELLWSERFSRESVDDLKKNLRSWGGIYAEVGQLQQRPSPRGGGMFKRDDWQFVKAITEPLTARARGWDLAATKDGSGARTAAVLMSLGQSGAIYIEHVKKGRWSDGEVSNIRLSTAKADALLSGPTTVQDYPQDPGQAGVTQKNAILKQLNGFIVYSSVESGDKADRARPLAAQQEGHNVFLVEGDWNKEFVDEAADFPAGVLKDQVDGMSRAYSRLLKERDDGWGGAPILIEIEQEDNYDY